MNDSGKYKSEKARRREQNRRRARVAAPFFTALFVLTIVAFIIPLRPTESESEKRRLTEFPDFTVDTLLSGEYFDQIGLWFSDTFPFRDYWLAVSTRLGELHGINDVVIYGDLGEADELPPVESDAPDAAPTETPEPTPTPEPTTEPTPPPTPEVVLTSPPEESVEHCGGLEVDDETEVIYGNVLQIGDAAFSYYGFSQYGSDQHIELVNSCADMLEQYGVELYDILIPTSVGIVVSSEYMELLKCTDQGQTISYIFSQVDENVNAVNVFNTLIEHNDEYLYFRTDHHWTALAAYYSYEQFCKVAGLEPAALKDFEELDMGPFLGSFYGNCAQSSKLREDNVVAYDPPGDITMVITKENGSSFEWPVLTDMSQSSIYSKYMTFLGGDHPLVTITNNDLPDGPNCVVIKDSFGNPFAPYLSQNYHNVYVIDYRKYNAMTLSYFVQYYDIDDVLLTESLAMAQGQGTLDLLKWLCK